MCCASRSRLPGIPFPTSTRMWRRSTGARSSGWPTPLQHPEDRREAAEAIRALIERVTLIPGARRGEMEVTLHGELGAILAWLGAEGVEKAAKTKTPGGFRAGVS